MPRANIVRYDKENFVIFGDTIDIKSTLMRCHCWYKPNLKHPENNKITPGWIVTLILVQKLIHTLEGQAVKVYLNGK